MNILPILGRELRARGHSPASYWGRLAVAAVGVLVCVPSLVWGPVVGPPIASRGAFHGLVGAAFLLCCGACLLTADAISRERREGTLILLLLTRVSRWDVLLGKLASNGLACFAGLLAFMPVLMLPLLAGGTTAGEAARNAVALVNTLFLALAAGLCASALGVDRFRASCAALLLMAAFVLVPLLLGLPAGLASPLGTVLQSANQAYQASPARFWISGCLVQTFAWALLWGAVAGLRSRAGQPEDGPARMLALLGVHRTGKTGEQSDSSAEAASARPASPLSAVKCRYCGRENAADAIFCHECGIELFPKPVPKTSWTLATAPSPLHWLLGRQRGSEPMLWLAALITGCQFAFSAMGGRFLGFNRPVQFIGFYWVVDWGFGLLIMAIVGALIASAASRFVIQAQRTGTIELLLTTPLGAEHLASTQWDIVKRMIRLPLLAMLGPSLLQGLFLFIAASSRPDLWQISYGASLLLGIINIVLSVGALCWLALWFAFRGMGPGRTVFWTVLLAYGLPYVLSLAWVILYQLLVPGGTALPNRWSSFPLLLGSLVLPVGKLLFYAFLIHLARSHLLRPWPVVEPFDLRRSLRRALPQAKTILRRARQWP
jgi:hypothetical protein